LLSLAVESLVALAVAERLSKDRYVEFKIALFNELFGPHARQKLFLGNDNAWPCDKRGANFTRSSAKSDGVPPSSRSLWSGTKRNDPNENSLGAEAAPLVMRATPINDLALRLRRIRRRPALDCTDPIPSGTMPNDQNRRPTESTMPGDLGRDKRPVA
jgi:hypothetical protein